MDLSERKLGQKEVQRYISFVADRFDVRRQIRFGKRVTAAAYNAAESQCTVSTDDGTTYTGTYFFTEFDFRPFPEMLRSRSYGLRLPSNIKEVCAPGIGRPSGARMRN
ncbi:hypothetical protein [Nocardia sp. NPDC005745]|uniref:hypothetical protein n=1 Tax=Nocardia sp. NPDC005745 TaxID=3157061 RepID=UPI0033C6681C